MVPEAESKVRKNLFFAQTLRTRSTSVATNRNTNKIFLWIGSVPNRTYQFRNRGSKVQGQQHSLRDRQRRVTQGPKFSS